jgi:hypothetical protein
VRSIWLVVVVQTGIRGGIAIIWSDPKLPEQDMAYDMAQVEKGREQ